MVALPATAFQDLFVSTFQLFNLPASWREVDIHDWAHVQASINSCLFASLRSDDSIDSRRTRWFVSDQRVRVVDLEGWGSRCLGLG